jgi:hypothetical protein
VLLWGQKFQIKKTSPYARATDNAQNLMFGRFTISDSFVQSSTTVALQSAEQSFY